MRAVVNVATGAYVKGQDRLIEEVSRQGFEYVHWRDKLPGGCPTHREIPYAFKAFALKQAIEEGYTTLLWADASILPVGPLSSLFERIEQNGYWIGNNGWTNYEWTGDSAYLDLFPEYDSAPAINRKIKHVVAGAFGVYIKHQTGLAIFEEYYRLAATTKAFCGPWTNGAETADGRTAPCGPPDVRGHRHDQTALSVIAWRMGCQLTNSPDVLSYSGGQTDKTILVMDGAY